VGVDVISTTKVAADIYKLGLKNTLLIRLSHILLNFPFFWMSWLLRLFATTSKVVGGIT